MKVDRQRFSERPIRTGVALLALALSVTGAGGELRLSADAYVDKLRGAKLAELIGDWSGLPTEGRFVTNANPASSAPWVLNETWVTDDDTGCEWAFLHMMETSGLDAITYPQIAAAWQDHFRTAVWCANEAARNLMSQGVLPPETGSQARNSYWNNMTRQFEGEIFGQIAPGMITNAGTRAAWWGRVTNEGNAVDTGAFISMMCADAFFTPDLAALIERAKAHFPTSSLTWQMTDDVQRWHARNTNDWRWRRDQVQAKCYLYQPCPIAWNGCEVNFCAKLLALLYGNGDFKDTLQIACLAGWDCDCNMATAGAIMGTLCGYAGMPAALRDACGDKYQNTNRAGLPEWDSITNVVSRKQALAEQNILARGGTISGRGSARAYRIVDGRFSPPQ